MSNSCGYEAVTSLTPYVEYSYWNPLNEVYFLCKRDVSSLPMTEDMQIFKLGILMILSNSELIVILTTQDKSKLTLLVHFY